MCIQYPWLGVLDIPKGRGVSEKHRWNGDKLYCPKTKVQKRNGIHTNGHNCDQCGEPLAETKKTFDDKRTVQDHCHAG